MQGTITSYIRKGRKRKESFGYRFRIRKPNGTWGWTSKKGFKYRAEAEEALRQALTEAGVKQPVLNEVPTFQAVLDQFLTDAPIRCTLGTIEALRKQSVYAARAFGKQPIDAITSGDLQKLFNDLRLVGGDRKWPLAPSTIKHIRYAIKCVFDLAVEQKYIVASPLTKKVKTPKVPTKQFNMPPKQRLKEVIQKARGLRFYALLESTAATGARMGEMLALQWPDFNTETGTLEISKALEDTKFGVRVKCTKSEKPRTVILPPSILAVLEEHRQMQQRDKESAGKLYDDQGYIFAPPQGGFYRPTNMSGRVSKFFRKHGFPFSMHKLRHAHGSILLSEGAPIAAVSDRLGHAKPDVTLKLYSHVIPGDRERLALMWDNDRKKAKVVEMFPHVPKKAAK